MSYVVLARKWRPQTFADLTGQQHVATTLTNAIARERVPHAMLFTGARGVGKTSTARILSMALNCVNGPTTTPCGTCDSCVEIQQGRSVDVLEIDGASNRGINEIRELRDGVRYAPHRDRHKIYIIDEVHMLTTEAFNALLKTLEEPPEHVVFLFATTEAHKIPVTILSRCQRFDFRRIPHGEIVSRLTHITSSEGLQVDGEVLALIARQAAGGMRDALSLMDQVIAFAGTTITIDDAAGILGAAERRRLFELSAAVLAHDVDAALRVLDAVVGFGVSLPHFAADLVAHLRDLVVVGVSKDPAGLTALTDTELGEARAQVASTDAATLHRMFEIMVTAAEEIARSNHASLVFEMAIVRMAALEPLHRLDEIIARLDAIAGGAVLPPGPGSAGPAPRGDAGGLGDPGSLGAASAAPPSPDAAGARDVDAVDATLPAETPPASAPRGTSPVDADPAINAPPTADLGSVAADHGAPTADSGPVATSSEAARIPDVLEPTPQLDTAVVPAPEPPSDELAAATTPVSAPDPPSSAGSPDTADAADAVDAPDGAGAADAADTTDAADAADAADSQDSAADGMRTVETSASAVDDTSASAPVTLDGTTWRAAVRDVRNTSERTSALLVGATLVHAEPGFVRVAIADALVERWTADDTMRLVDVLGARIGAPPRVEVLAEGDVDDTVLESGYQVHREVERERAAHVERVRSFVLSHRVIESVQTHWPGARVTEIHVPELPEETRP